MKNPLRKIYAAFFLLAIIPLAYTVYELVSLDDNEQIIRKIYQDQLDAILFSVNQHTDDIISSWSNRLGILLSEKASVSDTAGLRIAIRQFNALSFLFLADLNGKSILLDVDDSGEGGAIKGTLDRVMVDQKERIEKLIDYKEAGYQRKEPLDSLFSNHLQPILFISQLRGGEPVAVVLVIDLSWFVGSVLGPKIQEISKDQFLLSAFQTSNDSLIYSSEPVNITGEVRETFRGEWQKKDFWLLPGYYLGISMKGSTIEELVKERVERSLIFLVPLLILLIGGIIFLFWNIRKEMALSQAKSEFVSNVSHEIRTPLSLISMFAETLEMGRVPTEEKKKEYYSIIGKETARLSRIVNRILSFSRIEANKKVYHFEDVQLNELCEEILESYSYHLSNQGFTFEFRKDPMLKPVTGDRESIAEAVINLLDNAIKYSRNIKEIIIRTGMEHDFAFVSIQDKGIGIPRKYQHELFDQFFRAPTGDVHNTKGSGLGLTIVKKIMEAHGGEVKVESTPGNGSTFQLFFPTINEQKR